MQTLEFEQEYARLNFGAELHKLTLQEHTGDSQLCRLTGMSRKRLSNIYSGEHEGLSLNEMVRLFFELGYRLKMEAVPVENEAQTMVPAFAVDVAKYICNKLIEEGHPITMLELNSFLYLIQLEWLRSYGERLICDEFEAWDMGPILQEVFYHYCGFGIMPISIMATRVKNFHEIDFLISKYSAMDKWALLDKVKHPHGAWAQTYRNGEGNRNIIPLELMKEAGNG